MTSNKRPEDVTLDDALAAVRDDAANPLLAAAAAGRAWQRVAPGVTGTVAAADAIRGCADVMRLLPAYRQGELPAARALLVEDHLRECLSCRNMRGRAVLPWRTATSTSPAAPARPLRYAAAAAVLLALGIASWAAREAYLRVPPGNRAMVRAVSGALQVVAADRTLAIAPGAELGEAQAVRTTRGSRAVLQLRDGSTVEMSERAELKVMERGDETTIQLARGSIIVQAAKRSTGHLRVASGDCTVAVKGTVFSVSNGLQGSRVSVFEGRVEVSGSGAEKVLAPGDQWTTSAGMGTVPLREEIAWSGDLDRHLALLGEVQVLRERWRALPEPGLRYDTRLLRLVPETGLVFASIPNYGQTLGEAHRLFQERLQESAVLRELWADADPARHGGPSLDSAIEKVRSFSEYLGSELVLALLDDRERRRVVPVLLAEVQRAGLRELLEHEIESADPKARSQVQIVGVDTPRDAGPAHVFVLLRDSLVAVAADERSLQQLAARLDGNAPGLDATPFGERIAQAYGEGAGLLFAADLERITARSIALARDRGRGARALHESGLDGLRSFIFERKALGNVAHTQAVLAFSGPARGIPSWLAAPAPMGSLEYMSPGTQAVAAFVAKSPALIFDDVLGLVAAGGGRAREDLAKLESKLDLRLRQDIAETLGAEVALALDGPLLPTPAWKLVVEVYDPGRLQSSLQALVVRANDEALHAGRPGIVLEAEQVAGETYYAVRSDPFELHYAFSGGYLIAAPSRAFVMKAVAAHASGDTLARSAAFRALFPPDRDVNVSGLMYQSLGSLVGTLVEGAGSARITGDRQRKPFALAQGGRPSLLCAYGEEGGIRVRGTSGGFDFDLADLTLPLLLQRMTGIGTAPHPAS